MIVEWSKKNLPLTPDGITFGSNKVVWWKGSCGHEWQTSVKARSKGEKCPICSGARAVAGINDLSTLKPGLASEWSKKNEIKSTEVTVGSHKKVIWKCRLGHEWTASVKSRSINGSGCPYCSHNKVLVGFNDLATVVPKVADEWSEKNEKKPTEVTAFAKEHIEYDVLMQDYPSNQELVQGIFELILETVLYTGNKVIIASNEYPAEIVKNRFMKINYMHIQYVMECLRKNTTQVKNIKKYLLAALFNAPVTMQGYYQAEVNHAMPQFANNK